MKPFRRLLFTNSSKICSNLVYGMQEQQQTKPPLDLFPPVSLRSKTLYVDLQLSSELKSFVHRLLLKIASTLKMKLSIFVPLAAFLASAFAMSADDISDDISPCLVSDSISTGDKNPILAC